jgi:7-cyano-7-deazaguanine synthase
MAEDKAVVLLSGGLDSATTLAIAKHSGFSLYALTFRYGQRHQCEVEGARQIARSIGVTEHKVIPIDMGGIGGSALTDLTMEVPKDREGLGQPGDEIPLTYVPARNTIFLSYALAWAEVLNAFDIFLGVNATDSSGYPDCRHDYIQAFEVMANLATAAGAQKKGTFQIHTPIINMTKGQTILSGMKLGLDFSLTHSCYDPDREGRSCGRCDSCRIRLKGFHDAGLKDPVEYVQGVVDATKTV